jgi:NTE family protein
VAGRALVLGGGGVTGVAWEIGVIAGLAAHGVNLGRADVIVGTSAGSMVAAQITSGTPIGRLYDAQLTSTGGGITAQMMTVKGVLRLAVAVLGARDQQRARARVGAMALRARTQPEADRRAVIARRLPSHEWPTRLLRIPAVAADNGEFVVFDRDSGVGLVDAVGASCAVPGVWPPVTIGGRRYIDGGIRSPANIDVAGPASRIVVLAPVLSGLRRGMSVRAQIAALPKGTLSLVLAPDAASRAAIGRNVLDPARRAPAARAGRRQADDWAARVAAVWA